MLSAASGSPALPRQNAFSVPFESPNLLGTRVREDPRDGLVALLRDFSQNGATYVVPWKKIPGSMRMNGFDGALHSRIGQLRVLTPGAIQRAKDEVVAAGFAGTDAQRDELQRRTKEETRQSAIIALLTAWALKEIGIPPDALDKGSVSRERLEEACRERGLAPDLLIKSLKECGITVLPVGIAGILGGALEGPMRVIAEQLKALVEHLEGRAAANPSDRSHLSRTKDSAAIAAEVASRKIAEIDRVLQPIVPTLASWQALRAQLSIRIVDLQLALDGWGHVLAFHAGVIDPPSGTTASRAEILASIAPTPASSLKRLN